MTQLTREQAIRGVVMLLGTVIEMSDAAQKLDGATNISGVAAVHKMQTSIQKNRQRMLDLMQQAIGEDQGNAR